MHPGLRQAAMWIDEMLQHISKYDTVEMAPLERIVPFEQVQIGFDHMIEMNGSFLRKTILALDPANAAFRLQRFEKTPERAVAASDVQYLTSCAGDELDDIRSRRRVGRVSLGE